MEENSNKKVKTLWHAQDQQSVLEQLETSEKGLSGKEARERLETYGPNRLPQPRRRGPLLRFLSQFHNLLIYVLLGAAVVTALLGHWLDCAVILGVVLVNSLIGFIQEGKAEKALDSIRNLLSLEADVYRDGERREIPAEELVPGDLVRLKAGDKVPADLRLLKTRELRIDEAILTGESDAVTKKTEAVEEGAAVGDRFCMAYSGTIVTSGQATGVVVGTGQSTEIGRISDMLSTVEVLTTPLLRKMDDFARLLAVVIVVLGCGTFAFGYLIRDYSAVDMFLVAVGLVVASIPEGLPAIITITLAIGVQRMVRRHSIIRRLPAVETLGSVTVICSDKTGTLTRNEMTVQAVITADGKFSVEGAGYDPQGEIKPENGKNEAKAEEILQELGRAGLLCNESQLVEEEGRWQVKGDPTEGALLALARKLDLSGQHEQEALPRIDAIPFESENRFMATLHRGEEAGGRIYVKGAPEKVLGMCAFQRQGGEDRQLDREFWDKSADELADRGERVLALACVDSPADRQELTSDQVKEGLTLLGFVGISDPPRKEAIEAIAQCKTAGIRVKMITGDHARTARAIAHQMSIGDDGRVITGAEVEEATEEQLRDWVQEADIFARSSPEHKLRLVKALQANGQVVAMTGDGVNDAPALKRADVGVAMGIKGTEVAKEASEMVLTDDNFASIAHAVEEGRTVYDNIRKFITFILPNNGGEAMVLLAAVLLGRQMPITPVQILWVNMISAVTLALSLAFEPAEPDVMQRPPMAPDAPVLSWFLIWRIGYVSLILLAGTFGMFLYERNLGSDVALARTVAVNTLVMFEVFYLFPCRHLRHSVLSREGIFGSRAVWMAIGLVLVLQMLFTYAPPMQFLFGTVPMAAASWLRIIPTAFSVFVLVELEKLLFQRLRSET